MKRTFWGIILIALGAVFLLQSIAPGQYNFNLGLWPVLAIVGGLAILGNAFRYPNWFGIALGLWLSGYGVFETLHRAGVWEYAGSDILSKGWPLLLVAIGASIVFGRRSWWRGPKFVVNGRGCAPWSIGDIRYGNEGNWQLNQDMDLSRGIGDIKLDLTNADITDGEHKIVVNGGIGDVRIRVPDNVNVTVDAHAGIGDLEVFGEHRSGLGVSIHKRVIAPGSAVELRIECHHAIGDIRITHGPAISPRLV